MIEEQVHTGVEAFLRAYSPEEIAQTGKKEDADGD